MHPSLLLALLLPGCCLPFGDKDTDEPCTNPRDCATAEADADTDADSDADADADACDADITLVLPDGSEAALDCTSYTADATFEFDPDNAPEVRTLQLQLSSGESDGFECHVALAVT